MEKTVQTFGFQTLIILALLAGNSSLFAEGAHSAAVSKGNSEAVSQKVATQKATRRQAESKTVASSKKAAKSEPINFQCQVEGRSFEIEMAPSFGNNIEVQLKPTAGVEGDILTIDLRSEDKSISPKLLSQQMVLESSKNTSFIVSRDNLRKFSSIGINSFSAAQKVGESQCEFPESMKKLAFMDGDKEKSQDLRYTRFRCDESAFKEFSDKPFGEYDIYLIEAAPGLFEMKVMTVKSPIHKATITIANSKTLSYRVLESQADLKPGTEFTAGYITEFELENMDVLSMAPIQNGKSFLERGPGPGNLCGLPMPPKTASLDDPKETSEKSTEKNALKKDDAVLKSRLGAVAAKAKR